MAKTFFSNVDEWGCTILMTEDDYRKMLERQSNSGACIPVFHFTAPGDDGKDLEGLISGTHELMERLMAGHTILPGVSFEGARTGLCFAIEDVMEAFGLLTSAEAMALANRQEHEAVEEMRERLGSGPDDEARRARTERSRVICGNGD